MKNQIAFSQKADIETSSLDYSKRFSGEAGKFFIETQKNITLELLEGIKGSSVLDIGGGHAQITVPLVENRYKVTVVGSSIECRKILNSKLKPDEFCFEVADLLKLPYEDKSFDISFAFRLLVHEQNWKVQIKELCRVAKFAVIIDYTDKRSFNIFHDLLFFLKKKMEGNTRQFLIFNRKQISGEFEKNGFSKIKFETEYFFPMVIHRLINNIRFSKTIEKIAKSIGLTYLFGSPVIVRAIRMTD